MGEIVGRWLAKKEDGWLRRDMGVKRGNGRLRGR
jgi:hypothetical protein